MRRISKKTMKVQSTFTITIKCRPKQFEDSMNKAPSQKLFKGQSDRTTGRMQTSDLGSILSTTNSYLILVRSGL